MLAVHVMYMYLECWRCLTNDEYTLISCFTKLHNTNSIILLCYPSFFSPARCVCVCVCVCVCAHRCADSERAMEEQDFFRVTDWHEPARVGTTKVCVCTRVHQYALPFLTYSVHVQNVVYTYSPILIEKNNTRALVTWRVALHVLPHVPGIPLPRIETAGILSMPYIANRPLLYVYMCVCVIATVVYPM